MPTVLTLRNIRIVIYPNDHPPPHVHALKRDGARAKFDLNYPDGPVVLVEQIGFRLSEIAEMGEAITNNLTDIYHRWRALHG